MMAFAITFEDEDSMIVSTGAPRLRHVNQWAFDFLREEFESIGLRDYVHKKTPPKRGHTKLFDYLAIWHHARIFAEALASAHTYRN